MVYFLHFNIRPLNNYPIQANSDEVERFMVFTNYYAIHIKNLAGVAASLTRLSRKNVTF